MQRTAERSTSRVYTAAGRVPARAVLPSPPTHTASAPCNTQVLIRWAVQRGTSVLPKSVNPARIAANLDAFSWSLGEEDFQQLSTLPLQVRLPPLCAVRVCEYYMWQLKPSGSW